jgi:hypothetical protein
MAAKEGRASKIGGPIKSNPGGKHRGGAPKTGKPHGTPYYGERPAQTESATQKAPYSSTTPKN